MVRCRLIGRTDLDERRLLALSRKEGDRDRHGLRQLRLRRLRCNGRDVIRLRLVQRVLRLDDDVVHPGGNDDTRDLEEWSDPSRLIAPTFGPWIFGVGTVFSG